MLSLLDQGESDSQDNNYKQIFLKDLNLSFENFKKIIIDLGTQNPNKNWIAIVKNIKTKKTVIFRREEIKASIKIFASPI